MQGDPAGIGISGSERPNVTGNVFAGTQGTQFLNPGAFGIPQPGTFGNLGAFAIFGPPTYNFDAAAQKDFVLHEGIHANFRAEFFNFPNHLSYTGVNTVVAAQNFGQVNAATDPRTIELALRVSF
jgi:hypothetical protein